MGIVQKWKEYQPTKTTLAWTAAGASILTMIVGFTWGGWVTGSTARSMAEDAAQASHAQLAAAICAENFRPVDGAHAQLAEMAEMASFTRTRHVQDAAWSVLPDGGRLSRDAASLCAERIVAIDPDDLPASMAASEDEVEATEPETTIQ